MSLASSHSTPPRGKENISSATILEAEALLDALSLGDTLPKKFTALATERAEAWLAREGDPLSLCLLGLCAEHGVNEKQDSALALERFRHAAQSSYPLAMYHLARLIGQRQKTPGGRTLALQWLHRAAEADFAPAIRVLGLAALDGRDGMSPSEGVPLLERAARLGDAVAQVHLGACYCDGEAVSTDPERGVFWYQRAADAGHMGARCLLGLCYQDGLGVETDAAKAVEHFSIAAHGGDAEAQLLYALCLDEGEGTRVDPEAAANWLEAAALQGHITAQVALASALSRGRGREANPEGAFHWLSKAAQQGDAEALYQLGLCHAHGRGIHPDPAKAFTLFEMAAREGHADAHYCIGVAFARGDSVDQDMERSRQWIARANALGSTLAQRAATPQAEESLRPCDLAELLVEATLAPKLPLEAVKHTAYRLLASLAGADTETFNRALRCTLPALNASAERASTVALIAGALVESGAAANLAAPLVLERLPEVLRDARDFQMILANETRRHPEKDTDEMLQSLALRAPEAFEAWSALELWCQPSVAILARDAEIRRRARSAGLAGLLEVTRGEHRCATLLWRLLHAPVQEPLIVIEPSSRRAYELEMSGITDLFQLHTLLAHSLRNEGDLVDAPPGAEIVAVSQGRSVQELAVSERARWGFFSWRALRCDLELVGEESREKYFLSARAHPAEIERFEGKRVLLLGPLHEEERWSVARTFAPLRASMLLQARLDEAETEHLLSRMAAATDRCSMAN